MPQMRLDSLVGALASSVAEAEHAVRLQQIRNIRSFFGDDNEPVVVELKMPRPDVQGEAEGGPRHDSLKVPLITLVNVSHMSIAELEIKFNTSLGDVSRPEPAASPTTFAEEDPNERSLKNLGWSEDNTEFVDVSTGPTTSETGTASVTLKVRQSDTPEGLARLIARLNRML